MFCNRCGNPVPEGSTVCPRCNGAGAPASEIPTHLALSIIVTLLCCLPLGIVGIVYASKVSGLVAAGRYDEARAASDSAKRWSLWGLGIGLVGTLVGVLFQVIAAVAA